MAPGDLDPDDELGVAMEMIRQVGQSIQSADTKAGMLGAALGLLLAVAASDLTRVHATLGGAARQPHLAATLLLTFSAGLLGAGLCLGLVQLPRLAAPRSGRWLAFPAIAPAFAGASSRPTASELRDEAWGQVRVLAAIARLKFRYLRIGLFCSGLCALAFIAWLILAVALPA